MKKMSKLILSCALLAVAASTVACGDSATTAIPAETAENATADTTAAETEEAAYAPYTVDMGGRDFNIYAKMEGTPDGRWTSSDFAAEEATGDTVNDAIYERNLTLEEKFNCKIVNHFTDMGGLFSYSLYQDISKLVQAGDDTYDFYMPTVQDCAKLAADGLLWDLSAYDCVHLDESWWNQTFLDATAIGSRVYFANGDISETFMRAAYAIFFNKQKITDYDLDNPYDVVNAGNWTMDKLLAMSEAASEDLNGNGYIDSEDNIGLMVLYNSTEAFYAASGVKLVTAEDDGTLTWTGGSEKSIAVMNKIFDLYETETAVLCCDTNAKMMSGELKSLGNVYRGETLFSQGSALFLFGTMNNVKAMRSMDTDFGILPLPKADDSQSDYYSYVHTWSAAAACIPLNVKDPDTSAAFMEAAAYYAQQIITPAYYDAYLKTKVSRDEDSTAMLDIIYSKRWCDLGNIYNVGSVLTEFTTLVNAHKNTFASMIAKKEAKIESDLQTINDAIAENK